MSEINGLLERIRLQMTLESAPPNSILAPLLFIVKDATGKPVAAFATEAEAIWYMSAPWSGVAMMAELG